MPDVIVGARSGDPGDRIDAGESYVVFNPVDPCPWDLDDSGHVSTSDLLTLIGLWGSDPGGPPDFDGNGNVGTEDILKLLGAWGPCPK